MKKNVFSAVFLLALLGFSMVGGVLAQQVSEFEKIGIREKNVYVFLPLRIQTANAGETVEYELVIKDVHDVYKCRNENIIGFDKCNVFYNYNIKIESDLEIDYEQVVSLRAGESKTLKISVKASSDSAEKIWKIYSKFVVKVSEEGNNLNTATVVGMLVHRAGKDWNFPTFEKKEKPYFYSVNVYRPKIFNFIPNPFARKVAEIRAVNGSEFKTFKLREGEEKNIYGYRIRARKFNGNDLEFEVEEE